MALSYDLVSQFAKLVKDEKKTGTESTVYGTVVVDAHGDKYVRLDGSDQLTPLTDTSTNANDNERVSVLIKNHTATVTGNMSSPAARTGDVETLGDQISEIQKFDIVIAEQVQANEGYIKQLQTDKANVGDLTAATAKITELEANKASIEQLNATKAEITDLVADKIDAEVVNAKFATIESLNATNADIANLEADYGEFKDLTADNLEAVDATIKNLDSTYATIKSLEAEQARITDLEAYSLTANSAEIKNLQADVADIDTLIFGSATGTTIQTSFANAVIAMLGNAQIKSAMIDSVAANKITAGDIITNNVRVLSEDGKLLISDETIQISDDNRVRVQIGKDASGDYSISIWDADGNLMFSEGGITDNAIKDAIIRNDMVSDDANISASKLDISSLFTEINGSTQTINATKIYLDDEKQTLDVAFTSMTSDLDDLDNTVSSQGTALSVVQGKIDSKVWQQDINSATDELGNEIDNLTTKHSTLEQTVNGISATVGQHTSQIANKADSSTVTTVSDKVSELETGLNGFKSTVSETYATKVSLESAQSAAAQAQSKADQAKAAADAAQADVNALVTHVSTAETNISQNTQQIALRATKTEVTETLGGYYNKAQTEALIEETAEEINLSVSDVRTEVENINVGGRNLIADTSLDTVYSGSKGTSSYKDVWAAKTINIPTATEYIVSFDAKADVAQNIRCYFYSPNTTTSSESSTGFTSNSIDGQAFVAITTEWKRYWVKWKQTPADAVKSVIVGRTETDSPIYIRAVKLEEGNRATSWSPAPEDFYTKEQTKAQIKIESDAITNTVSSTYATKTALSDTDRKAGDAASAAAAAQNDIDNLNIGGRNLLLNTNGTGDIKVDGGEVATAGITQYTNDGVLTLTCSTQSTEVYYRFMNPSTSASNLYSLKAGETYAISGKAMINVTSGTLTKLVVRTQAYRSGGWSGGIGSVITDVSTTDWVDFEFPFTVESDATGYYISFQIYYTGTFAATVQFKDLKLEHGTRATDWSPAPEDVDAATNSAQEKADSAYGKADDAQGRLTSAETTIQQLADSIAAVVRDGNGGSMLKQDSSGLWYFDISGLEKTVSDTANDLDDLEGIVLDANSQIDVLQSTAQALQKRTEYVRSYTDENDQPCLELGEGDSVFKVRITNTDIQFMEGSAVPTRINRQMLIIEKAMVRQELQFGDDQDTSISGVWLWKRRTNGNLGLMWKEVSS